MEVKKIHFFCKFARLVRILCGRKHEIGKFGENHSRNTNIADRGRLKRSLVRRAAQSGDHGFFQFFVVTRDIAPGSAPKRASTGLLGNLPGPQLRVLNEAPESHLEGFAERTAIDQGRQHFSKIWPRGTLPNGLKNNIKRNERGGAGRGPVWNAASQITMKNKRMVGALKAICSRSERLDFVEGKPSCLISNTAMSAHSKSSIEVLPGRGAFWGVFLIALVPMLAANAQTVAPTTVEQAVFRYRWVGEPADRGTLPSSIYQADDTRGLAGFLQALRTAAAAQEEGSAGMGLRLGPVIVHPAVTLGWEYSDENADATEGKKSSNNSAFIVPALTVGYFREVGPWTVDARYSGSYTFYTDPNYNSSGGGGGDNPFQNTASLLLGLEGSRYTIQANAGLSYGSGFNIESGQNDTQLSWTGSLTGDYQLTEDAKIGGSLSASQDIISQTETSPTGTLGAYEGKAYADYAWTGKTRFRLELGAGQDSQGLSENSNQSRQYGQILGIVIYEPTPKLNISAGIGCRYVSGTGGGEAEEVGFRPAYRVKASYQITEKTSASASLGMEGTDLRPSFNFQWTWEPRLNTSFAINVYQTQEYSTVLTSQARVTRGVAASIAQTFFSRAQVTLSGGFEQWDYVGTTNDAEGVTDNQNQARNFAFVSCGLSYRIQDWVFLNGLLWIGSDRDGQSSSPQVRANVGLTFTY